MSNLDNKKYLESILQSCDDEEDFGGNFDVNMENIDVDMILNETDDFHVPIQKLTNKNSDSNKKLELEKTSSKKEEKIPPKIIDKKEDLLLPVGNKYNFDLKDQEIERKLAKELEDFHDDLADPMLINEILDGIDDLDNNSLDSSGKKEEQEHLDPLERIDREEKEISKNKDYHDLESKFVLSNNIAAVNTQKFNNIIYEPSVSMSEKLYNYYSDKGSSIQSPVGSNFGIPKCIAVFGEKYVVVGTSYSYLCVFDNNQKDLRIFGTVKEQNFGAVTALDISYDGESLVAGYEKGQIILWDLYSGGNLKTILGIHDKEILCLKFYKETKNHIISSDNVGFVYLITVNKVLFSYTVDKQLLLSKSAGNVSSIRNLRSQDPLYAGHMVRNYTLVALCSLNVLLIISLEPMVRILYKMERPEYIKEGSVPYISWGKGCLKNENLDLKNPILAISWGNMVFLMPIPSIDLYDNREAFQVKGLFCAESDINYMSWIAPNLLFIMDSRKIFKILYSGYFEKEKNVSSSSQNSIVMNAQQIDSDISFQTYFNDSTNRVRSCFQNTVAMNEISNSVYMLGYKKLFVGRLFKWNNFIYSQLEKGEWMSSLYLCLELYKGNNKMFSDIPVNETEKKNKMKPVFNDIIKRYVEDLGDKLCDKKFDNESFWETYIITTIDFLVSIENFDYLFTNIKNLFKKFNLNNAFLKCLEPFILKNKIKYILNEPFREIVSYYRDADKLKVVQHLIINLDINSMDTGFIISLCLEHHLFAALIYICNRSDDDFITPLVKMFAVFRGNLEVNGPSAQEDGYKCLWYVKMTINGIMFPEEKIPDERYEIVLKQMVVWIFVEENLKALIEIDPEIMFNILLLLFQGRPKEVLEQSDQDMVNYFKSQNKSNKFLQINDEKDEKFAHWNILALIFACCPKENKKIRPFFMDFVAKIVMSGKFNLDFETCLECAYFLLENSAQEALKEEFNEEKSKLILNLLKVWENELKTIDFSKLIEASEASPYIEVLSYLYYLQKEYQKCLDLILESKYKNSKKLVFEWVEFILQKLESNKEQFKNVFDYILERLKDLVVLNSEKTKEIIKRFNKSYEKKAILHLAQWPPLQLELLGKILEERKNGSKIDNDLLVLNVSLLCKQGRKQELLQELKNFDYPLDQCLKLCKEHSMNEATAFLLERTGAVLEALILYLQIFEKNIQKAIRKIEKGKNFDYQSFYEIINMTLDVCKKNNKMKDKESENLWFSFLDKLLELHNEHLSTKNNNPKYEKLFDAYSDIIGTIFEEIIKNVSLLSLVNQIGVHYGQIDLKNLKKSFMAMLSNYSYEENILNNSKKLVVNDIIDNGIRIFAQMTRGISLKPYCSECKSQFIKETSEKNLVFFCCHSFHLKCNGDYKCLDCARDDAYQLDNLIQSFKNKMSILKNIKKGDDSAQLEKEKFDEEEKEDQGILNLEQLKSELRDKTLRKLKMFDYRKEDERTTMDTFRARYE